LQDNVRRTLGLRGVLSMLVLSVRPLLHLLFMCPIDAVRVRLFVRRSNPNDKAPPQFILASILQWYDVWQRPQHFASRLSSKFEVCFLSPVPVHHIVGESRLWLERRIKQVTGSLTVFAPLLLPGENKVALIRAMNRLLWVSYLREAVIKLRMAKPVLWLNFPFNDRLVRAMPYREVIYDVMDEFVEFSIAPKGAVKRETKVLEAAAFVSTGTYSLSERMSGLHDNVEYIPCGVDFELFNAVARRSPEQPHDFPTSRGPVLGYFGSLNERIDSALIESVARRRPGWTFVLLGPFQRSYSGRRDFGNIHYLGLKAYRSLPAYLAFFDICMMPYKVTEATKKISPVKLLEYFAAGKPVITTRIPDVLRFYESLVWVADDADEFITKAEAILRMRGSGQFSAQTYIDVAKRRSWEQMSEQMLKGILEALQ